LADLLGSRDIPARIGAEEPAGGRGDGPGVDAFGRRRALCRSHPAAERQGLTLTGQLGEVMQESAKAAQSYLWAHAEEYGIDAKTFSEMGVHIHVPAGAIPKDGPSAGITAAVALASLYSKKPARNDTAMTGEITLTGRVLPIGGVKEKVLAARRAGLTRVVMPKANAKDLRDLPEHVRKEMEFIFAERRRGSRGCEPCRRARGRSRSFGGCGPG
jgi:ATP-dependent Lon protease